MPDLDVQIYRFLQTKTVPDLDDVVDALPEHDPFTVKTTLERMIERSKLRARTVRKYLLDDVIVTHSWIRAV